MDGEVTERWSAVAEDWADMAGEVARPVWQVFHSVLAPRPDRALDVGCGAGHFVAFLRGLGIEADGVDPAPGMIKLARQLTPDASVRAGAATDLPFADASFDLVTAINSLQFADDLHGGLQQMARVVKPGGVIGISNWAEDELNDLETLEAAAARSFGEETLPEGRLQRAGGHTQLFDAVGGIRTIDSGLVCRTWEIPDDATLIRLVLMGRPAAMIAHAADTVLDAAAGFRTATNHYRLHAAFRYTEGQPSR